MIAQIPLIVRRNSYQQLPKLQPILIQVCVTVIRVRSEQVMLTRNCKQKQACEEVAAQNQRTCDLQR